MSSDTATCSSSDSDSEFEFEWEPPAKTKPSWTEERKQKQARKTKRGQGSSGSGDKTRKYKAVSSESAQGLFSASKAAFKLKNRKKLHELKLTDQDGKTKVEKNKQIPNFLVGPSKGTGWKRQSWDDSYAQLFAFQQKNGHCNVNLRKYPRLGSWVTIQKGRNRKKLTREQIDKLNDIGFNWEKLGARFDQQWEDKYHQLLEYRREHGTVHVPIRKDDNEKTLALANWCGAQRWKYSKGTMREDRKQRLEKIGFLWVVDETRHWKADHKHYTTWEDDWMDMYGQLFLFHEQHGHCLVPWCHYEGKKGKQDTLYTLGRWVRGQRTALKENRLIPARKQKLDHLHFVWTVDAESVDSSLHQRQWEELFNLLLAFKKKTGHTLVSRGYKDQRLAQWVDRQRYFSRQGTLLESREERLREIGFWFGRDHDQIRSDNHEHYNILWQENFEKLKAFKRRFGHARVPNAYADDAHLGNWASSQRQLNGQGKMLKERQKLLNEIGFEWSLI